MRDSENDTCIFCRIARGEIPASFVHEDAQVVAFEDLNPQAPEHTLIIPRRHVVSADGLEDEDGPLIGQMILVARDLARKKGLVETGYRLVTNVGENGGQSVSHLHLHLLGGRRMSWPPG